MIVAVALWIIVGEQMAGASANAVVNARLSTLRTPIAGEVEMPDRALGAATSEGEVLATVVDPLADAVRLDDLQMERNFAFAEVARLEALVADTRGTMAVLERRGDRFAERQIAELELRLSHARDRLRLLGVNDERAEPEETLAGDPSSLEQSRAREEVDVLENALAAARAGVFIGDGYNDAPNSQQRLVELETLLAELQADLRAAQSRVAALGARVEAEQVAVNRLAAAEIRSTVDGQVWDVLAADGERLQRGEPVLRLVDCGSLVVTLSVTETVYNRLRIGDAAEFRLAGSGEVYPGTVTRLAGSGAATVYRNLAVAPSRQHLERYDVALLVPGLRADPDLQCPVGRTGRAFFERRPLDWLRALF
ncbi:HlyD family secretion protein [Tranquillimonas alkanivorans]|uniref:HlyD family secretion protein n=1 Tax=Tranquillimonas alkanivorans TaxID=441119 RepID=UPI001FE06C67|nr:HlyD family efflux transporter periplasmic adaptor subunit [Tranquillimonas alkanivorans]